MRLCLLGVICAIQLAGLQARLLAGSNADAVQRALQSERAVPVTIEAPVIEKLGSVLRAYDGVVLRQGAVRIGASGAVYDMDTGTGTLRDAVFTTCSEDEPDYRIESGQVSLLSNGRLRVRRASVYMGRWKLITLPTLNLRLGSQAASRLVFPKIGYDRLEGLSLAHTSKLVDTDRLQTLADVRLTTMNGVQGEATGSFGIDGVLLDYPGRLFDYASMHSRALDLPRDTVGPSNAPGLQPVGAARLRLHAAVSRRQRVLDIGNENLTVSRRPEVGVTYTGSQINFSKQPLDPRLEIYPQATVVWGRYDEVPAAVSTTARRNIAVLAPVNFLDLGPRTTVQPVVSYSISGYGSGDTYRTWSYALDASRMFADGSYASLRFIRRHESGSTPFEFDDVDVRREMQAAAQTHLRRHVLGLALYYDFDKERLYEWEVLYAHRTDCLIRALRWNSRLKRFSVDIALTNL